MRTVVARDRDYTDGHLEEGELSFLAQEMRGSELAFENIGEHDLEGVPEAGAFIES